MFQKTTSIFSTLIGSSVLATGLAATSSFIAPTAKAYTLTEAPACDVAAAVFNPAYDNCAGAYLLGNGENDVTDGDADNIVNQILNVDNIFGNQDWTFLGKKDNGADSGFFTVNGIGSTSGNIVFNTAAIEADYGSTFIEDYDIAVSFKAAKNFSIYEWDAALGTNTIEWSTAGTATNKKGSVQALSHASVYFRLTEPPRRRVPEPSAILGYGLLLGLGAMSQKKYSKKA